MKKNLTPKKSWSQGEKDLLKECRTDSAAGITDSFGKIFLTKRAFEAFIIAGMFLVMLLLWSHKAAAQIQNSPYFEIDGNATTTNITGPPDDWDLIYAGTSHAQVTTGILTNTAEDLFTGGSSDIADVSTWRWTIQNSPDKDFINNAGAALYGGDKIFFFGDRFAGNGDANIGFWFFKDKVGPLPDGTFSGHHEVGDIFLVSAFVNGGGVSAIAAYEWVGSGGDNGSLQSISVNGINLYAITNAAGIPSPWPYTPKSGPSGTIPSPQFYEGGIDLTGLGLTINPCFTSFLLETRTSQSLTAELKSFIGSNFFTAPQITFNSPSICNGGSATLTATVTGGAGPFSYSWNNGATSSSITVSPSVTTTYTVTVTTSVGCVSSGTGTVNVNPIPACSIGGISPSNLICNHGNYTVSATVNASSYSWSMSVDGNPSGWAIVGSNTAQTITFSAGDCGSPGFMVHFTLTITDANGCTSSCSQAFAPGAPACNVSIRPPVVLTCGVTSQYLLTSYATDIINPTFSWSLNNNSIGAGINNGNGLDSILISAPGNYRFNITDPANNANTCNADIDVIQNITSPGATANGVMLTCAVTSVQLMSSSPASGVSFSWTGPGGFTSSQQNPFTGTAGTYIATVTNPMNGCTSTATATVDQNINTPGAIATGGQLTCISPSIQINSSSPAVGVSYSWSGPGGFNSSQQNPIVSIPGIYIVEVTDPGNGCTSTAEAIVTQDINAPGASAFGCTLNCIITSMALVASSPTSGVTYSWVGPGGFTSNQQDPTVSVAGTYTVTVTNPANGCTSTATATINQNITPPPCSIGNLSPSNLICNHGNYSISTTLDTSLYTLSWSMSVDSSPPGWDIIGSNTGQSITFSAGNCGNAGFLVHITLTVTDKTNGCLSTCSKTFAPGAPACNVSVRPPVTLTCVVTSQYLLVSYATDIINPDFEWTKNGGSMGAGINNGTNLDSILITDTGTYRFTITDPVNSANTCYGEVTVIENIVPPGANANGGILTCAVTSIQLSASSPTGGVTFKWNGPGGFNSSNQNPTVSVAGTYTVTVTNPVNGCTSTAVATVSQNITAPGAAAVGCVLNCVITSAQIGASSPTSGVTFSWKGPGGFNSSTQNPTVNTSGTYTVTVTNPINGCTSTATAVVTQNITAPGASASGGTLTCAVTSVQLSASSSTGGVTFSWSGPGGFNSSNQNPTVSTAGTYTVTVTNTANGCTSTATAVVTQNITAPGANATGGTLTCAVTSVKLNASSSTGGVTYSWSGPGGFTSSTQNPTISTAGTYTVTITNPVNGCTSTATATVAQDITPPGANANGGTLTCAVTSLQLSASSSTGGVTFKWSGPGGFNSSNQNPTVNTAGTYTVTVTNPVNGCTSTATAVVTQNITAPGASATGGELTCAVTSIQLNASSSTNGVTFSWKGPRGFTSGQQDTTVNAAGTYTVTVTNPVNGCTSTATAVVTQNITAPGASATGGELTCVVTSIELSASSSTNGVTFSWSGPNGFTSGQQDTTTNAAGTYTVTATNPVNGCTSTATAVVTQNITTPGANASGGTLTCAVTSIKLTASSSTGGVTFSWSGPGGFTSSTQNPTVSTAGTYTVTITNPVNGCTSTATATVAQDITPPGANANGGTLTCAVTSLQLSASSSTGGVTFKWSGPGGFNSSNQNPSVNTAGTYTVTVTNPVNGCTSTATAVVTQNITAPGASATGGELTCAVTSIQLNASSSTNGVTFNWKGPKGFISNQQDTTVNAAGTYTVTVTNSLNGCTSTATAVVTQNITAPGASATGGELTCVVTSIELSASSSTNGVTFSWSGPNGFTSGQQDTTASTAGTYTVTVTNPVNGCTSNATAVVTQNIIAPGANASGGTLTCAVTSIKLTASSSTGGVTFSWSGPGGFTSSTQNPTVSTAGTYTVTITNPVNGCTSTATATVAQDITPPGANANGGTLTCAVTSLQLSASSSTGGVTFKWSGPGGFNSSNQNPTVNTAGTYTVTVTNPVNGCTSTATAVVTQNITAPGASATGGELTCAVTSIQLNASSSTNGVTFSWKGPRGFTSGQQDTTVNAAGTYTVTVTNPVNGCTSTATAVVTQNITAPGASATGGELTCVATSIQLNANSPTNGVIYGWSGPNGFTSGQQDTTTNAAGTYTVTATNPVNGCTSTATAVVTQNITTPGANASGGTLTCAVTSIKLTASSSTGGVTFSWSGPGGFTSSTQNPTVSTAGTYTVTITNPVNGCTSTATATVAQDITPPGANANGGTLTCAVTSLQLSASSSTGGVTFKWSGPGGFNSSNQNPSVNTAGIYTVTVTNPVNGCTSTATATVTQDITPPGASATGGELTCVVTSIQLSASSSTNGVTFSWKGPRGFTSGQQDTTVNAAGTYTVTVTNPVNGCTSTATAVVTQNITSPGASATGGELTCVVTSVQVSASSSTGGVTFSWSGPNGFTSGQQDTTASAAGTYTVTVTNPVNGCTSTATAVVTQNITTPGANASGGTLTCAVTSVKLNASSSTGGVTYSWSGPGGFTSSTQNPTITVAGTYTVTVTNPVNGCTSTATATVIQNITTPGANASGGTLTCAITSLQLSASSSTGGVTFKWSGPGGFNSSNQNPTVNTAGTYTVTVTDPVNGCTSTATATVTQDITPPGAAAVGCVLNCVITSAQIGASSPTSGVTFSWKGPGGFNSSTQNPTVNTAGTYTVTVTNPINGCTSTATAVVTQNITAPGASASGGTLTCSVTSIQITANSTTGGVTFSWSGPNGFTSGQQDTTVSAAGTYTVTVTNPVNGCTSTATAVVTQNITAPGANASGGTLTCAVTSVKLSASTSTGGVTFSWSGPGGFNSPTQNPTVSVAGTYTVTVTNPVNGCTSTATATVTQDITPPGANANGGTLTCAVTSLQLSASSSTGGVTFKWSGPGGFNSSNQNPTVSTAGTYTVTVTNPVNGCTSTATAIVTQDITPPGANATGGELTCAVTSIQLSASSSTNGVSFSWKGPKGFISNQQDTTVNAAGNYTVTVTNPINGCTSTATAVVTQNITSPGASATGGELTCAVTSVQVSASSSTGGVTFSWSGPNGFTSGQQDTTASAAGTYTITVTNPVNGCTSTATAVVTQNITTPGANASGGTLTCAVTSVKLNASSSTGGVTYSWSGPGGFTSSTQNPTVSNAGTYTVTVTNPVNGCTSTATATVIQNITAPGSNANGGTLTCAVTSIQLSASSSTGGVTFKWSGPGGFNSSNQNPTVNTAGIYTVTVTNPVNGCTSTATATVSQNITPPGAAAVGCILNCVITSDQISASSPTAGVTFAWSGPGGFSSSIQNPTVTVAGTYTVTVTNPVNGCTSTATATVTQNITPPPCSIGNLSPSNLICNHGNYSISTTLDTSLYTLSWSMSVDSSPPGWDIIGSTTGQSITFSAGNCGNAGFLVHITLTVTDKSNGCISTCSKTFAPGAPACNVSVRPPVTLTCVVTSQYLLVSYATDIINPAFEWSKNGGSIGAGINNGTNLDSILITDTGTYRFTITDPANSANTCFGEVTVIENTIPPGASASGGTLTCVTTSVQLSANSSTGGVTFSWKGPGGFNSSTQNPTVSVAGTYTVTVTNPANGCTSTAMATVTQYITPPGASATGAELTCVVTSIQLSASSSTGGVTFSWSGPGGFNSSSQNPTVSVAGTYTVTVTNPANGCTSTAIATVTQNITSPGASANGGALTCSVTSVQLSATSSTGGVTFSWSGPGGFNSSAQNPTVNVAGTYTVTVINPLNGCTSTAEAEVTENITPPGASAFGCVLNCIVTSMALNASSPTGDVTYSWTGPGGFTSTQQDPVVSVAGTYTVTVTDPVNGCTSTATATIIQNITPPPCAIGDISPSNLICNHGNYSISSNLDTTLYSLSWTISVDGNPAGWDIVGSAGGETLTISAGDCGNAGFLVHISLTVIDKTNGCVSTCSRSFAPGAPACNVSIRPPVALGCVSSSQYLLVSYATDIINADFEWTKNGGSIGASINNGMNLDSILITDTGTYRFTITDPANSANTCFGEVTVIENIASPGANAGGGALTCSVTSVQLSASSSTGGVTFNWNGPGGFSSSNQNPIVSIAGTYTVTVTNPANGCTGTAEAEVTENVTPPGASAFGCVLNCIVTSMALNASSPTGGVTYSWTGPGGFTSTQQDPIVSVAGIYTVTVTDPVNGCTSTATATIIQNITPPPCTIGNLSPSNLICNHGNYSISSNLDTTLYSLSWTISVDGNPGGWDIIGSAGGETLTFSAGDCGNNGFEVHISLTVVDKTNGCVSTCSKSFAPGAPACNVSIRPPAALTCATTSQYLLVSYATDILSPMFNWTKNDGSIGAGINNGINLDSILITDTGTYRFIVTDPSNLSDSCFAEVTVSQNNTVPDITATGGTITCVQDTIQLTGSSSVSNAIFSWTGPNGFTSTQQNPVVSDSGIYKVVITDLSNGCTNSDTALVIQIINPIDTGTCGSEGPIHGGPNFELDGDAVTESQNPPPDDWDLVYYGTSHANATTGILFDAPSKDDNSFVQGTKDVNDIPNWHWRLQNVPDKDDLLHGGAALYGTQLFFFGDRYAVNGDAQIGFWLFRKDVHPLANGTFSGTHSVGDLLILSDFDNGGRISDIFAYEWVGSGGSDGALNKLTLSAADAFAIVNTISVVSPWPYTPKFGPSGYFPPNAFFEGGVDLACISGLDMCFASFLVETRASQSADAELKDFIFGTIGGSQGNQRMEGDAALKAYPNPFSSQVTIEFTLNDFTGPAIVEIYNMSGQKVTTLFDNTVEKGATYKVNFDGENMAAGIYFYRVTAGNNSYNHRMILIK